MRLNNLFARYILLFLSASNACFAQNETDVSQIAQQDAFYFCQSFDPIYQDSCGGWFLLTQYLYWQPRSDAWPFVERVTPVSAQNTTLRIVPDYHSGVRWGLAYSPKSWNRWDFGAFWTHLFAHDTSSASTTPGTVLVPIWIGPTDSNVFNAQASNNLTINFADLDMGYAFECGGCLAIHPHFGFRGLWIQNKLNVDYAVDVGGGVSTPVVTRNKINFQGYGVRVGLDAKWNFWRKLSLIERSGISLLKSKVSIDQRPDPIIANATATIDTNYIGAPLFDLFIGLRWDWCCSCGWLSHINAHIGWEENFFLGVIPLEAFVQFDSSSRPLKGDLGLGGLTTGLVFVF